MRRANLGIVMVLATALFLAGCASLGPKYQKVEMIPSGKAVVYIYRPSSMVGAAVSYDVRVGDRVVTTLYNGGYYPYVTSPGEVEVWAKTESKSSVTLDVKPGQIYFVKGTVGMGAFVGRPRLQVVPTDEGSKEIVDCKLIPEPDQAKK